MITSATIRKIANGFILSTTQTIEPTAAGFPVMASPGIDQFFPSLADVAAHLDAEGFDDFNTQVPE